MSYQDIYQRLTALGTLSRGSTLTLDRTMLGDAISSEIMLQVLGTDSLSLNLQYHSIEAEVTVLQGFCTVLSITDAEYKLQLDSRAGDFTMTLELALPSTWKFSTSFPELPAQLVESKGVKSLRPNILDTLSMGASKLIFSNRDLNHEGTELVRGLNFTGECYYSGLLFGLGTYIDFPGPVPMSGPVMRYRQAGDVSFAGVSLTGNLQFDGSLGGLEVQRTLLRIKSAVKADHVDWTVDIDKQAGVYFLMETQFMGRDMQLIGRLSDGKQLDLSCVFTDFAMTNLGAISQSTGGDETELSGALPSDASSPQGIHITDMSLGIDFKARKVKYIGLGVGMQVSWSVVPGAIELENVGVRVKVGNPFEASKRVFQVTLLGTFALGDARVGLSGTYPGYEVAGQLISGELKVGAALDRYLPGVTAMADMRISKLVAMASPTAKTYTLVCQVDDLLTIPVGSSTLEFNELSLFLNRADGATSGMFSARLGLGSADFVLSGTMGNQYMLSGTAENLSLHELLGIFTNGATIPEEVPEVLFSELNVQYAQSGDFTLTASAMVDMDTLPFDSSLSTTVSLAVSRQSGNWTVNLTLSGTGAVNFAEGFRMDSYALNFSYGSTSGWSLGGTVGATIADKAVSLTAAYVNTTGVNKFSLSATSSTYVKILDVSGYFIFSWKRFDMAIEKTVVEGQPDRKSWSLRLDSRVSVPSISTFDSSAEIAVDSEGKRMIKVKPLTIKAYNHAIADGVGISFKPKELCLTKESNATGWKLVGAADLGITGVTGKLGKALPSALSATVTLGKGEAKVEMLNPMNPIDFPLPKADGQSLGKFVLQIMKIGVSLKPTVGFTAQLGLGFPKELNTYFKRQVFREYEAGNPMSMALLDCTVASTGIGLQFTTSPFLSGNTTKAENGEDWINFDFGDCGEIAMKMPSFKYNMASSYFEASGGFKIVRDLSLPLTPLRNFLDGVGMGAAKAIFPEKLPIKGISLVDENDNFKTEDLITMLGDVPNDVKTALRGAGNLLNRFPDGFKSYLKFEIPSQLEFKFGFSPLGRVSFALSAPVEPIRFLYPGMVQGLVPMPGLIGIELRKLNIGTLASGSLFFGDIDAVIDMYDLPSLVTSLALPTDPGFPLPTSDQLQRRIILKNVFSIIPLSQGVPVPVPVFHDEIGFEYMGLEGIGIQAHMGIPQPDFAAGGTELLKTLVTFFKDRSYKLDPNKAPGGQQIKFRFRDEYLQAPEYLGGGKVGTSDTVIEIGTWKYVAQLMNFCKRFALEHLIASVPLENRMANKSTKLAFFEVDGQYLITTPEEFDSGAYTALGLNADQRQDFRDVLPGVQTGSTGAGNGSSGLVMFLRGAVKAGSIFEMQACYGLAISGTMGFNTGFKFEGKVGGFVEAEIRGALLLNAKDVSSSPSYPVATPVSKPVAALPQSAIRGERKALTLNGSTYIEIPYSNLHDLRQFTVELWVNLRVPTTDWVGIIGRESGNYGITISKRGEIYAYGHSPNQAREFTVDTISSQFKFDQWQHIAYTFNGERFTLYINGKSASSYAPWDGNQQVLDATPIVVGRDYHGTNPAYLQGSITELRIWKRARTEKELGLYYNERMRGMESNLVSLYPLDAANGGVAPDFCSGVHAKLVSGGYDAMAYRLDQGVYFDGSRDRVYVPVSGGLLTSSYTLQLRFRFAEPVQLRTQTFQLFDMPNLAVPVVIGGSGWTNTAGETATRFVTVTVVTSSTTRKTYVEGALLRQEVISTVAWRDRITIGGSAGGEVLPFKGYLMDFQVWKTGKSDNWVAALYNNPTMSFTDSTLLGMYMFPTVKDGQVQSVKKDNFAKLELQGLGAYQPAFTPSGLRFSSNTQVATVPITSKLDLPAYTVEMWFKPEVIDGEVRFLTRFLSGNPRIATVSGAVEHRWLDEAGTYYSISAKSSLIPKGKWSHIAATHDGLVGKLYINGVLAASKTSAKPVMHKATEIIIGRNGMTDIAGNLNGCLDELRIWSVVKTEAELQALMYAALAGNETGLVAYYAMDPLGNDKLLDRGPSGLHGTKIGFPTAVSSPVESTRYAVQAYGHTHLRIGGHEVMVADMQLKDDTFWFKGKLNLFPDSWPVRVYGDAEAYISKEKLYLYASTDIELCGLKLAKSRALITHERVRLEGEWLGIYTLLDVQWAGSDPHFKGELSADWSGRLEFGAIYIRGVRVCDNLKLDFRVGFKLALDFDRSGFGAQVGATFKIAGVGFSLNFSLNVAPTDLMSLVNQLRDRIAKDAERFFAHLFSDALAYAEAFVDDAIEFVEDSYQVFGHALSVTYQQTISQVGNILNSAGANCQDIVLTLCNGAGAGLDTVAQLCNSLGHDLGTIASAMKEYTGMVGDVGKALNSIGGKTATQIAGALKTAGWDLIATSHGVQAFLNDNWKELLNSLDEAWDDVDVVRCLKNTWRKSMKEIAGWHKELSYAAQKSFDYLKQAWNATEKAVAQVMKDIGRACSQVASLLKKYLGGDAAAQVLKDIGFSKDEVTGAMKTAYNWTTDQVNGWLDKAGSWANTAGGWVNDAGDWLGL